MNVIIFVIFFWWFPLKGATSKEKPFKKGDDIFSGLVQKTKMQLEEQKERQALEKYLQDARKQDEDLIMQQWDFDEKGKLE